MAYDGKSVRKLNNQYIYISIYVFASVKNLIIHNLNSYIVYKSIHF